MGIWKHLGIGLLVLAPLVVVAQTVDLTLQPDPGVQSPTTMNSNWTLIENAINSLSARIDVGDPDQDGKPSVIDESTAGLVEIDGTGAIQTPTISDTEAAELEALARQCTIGDDSTPIPDACVGDGVDDGAGGTGHTIEEEGSGLAARANLNFVGPSITCTDDAGNDETDCTVDMTPELLAAIGYSANLAGIVADATGRGPGPPYSTATLVFSANPFIYAPDISGQMDMDVGSVNDDDCTGDQGKFWYDNTDTVFKGCEANAGAPLTFGTGGGGGGLFNDLTDVTISAPATGATLIYDGAAWIDGQLDLADNDARTGTLPVANGGTGAIAFTNLFALATDTTGNYVGAVADGTGIDGTAAGENATYTPTFDATELTTLTWGAGGGGWTWTFNTGTTDPAIDFGDGFLRIDTVPVRVGDAGTVNTATGDGDLYVEDALEVDGAATIGSTLTVTGNLQAGTGPSCIILRDSDDNGDSACSVLDGTFTCQTDTNGICGDSI